MNARTLTVFRLYQFFNGIIFTGPIWAVFLLSRGLSLTQFGFVEASLHVGMLIAQVPTGALADALGRRRLLVGAGFFTAAAELGYVYAPGFGLICLAGAIHGVAFALRTGADEAYLFDSLAHDDAQALFPRMLGGLWAVFQFAGAISFLGFLGTWWFVPERFTPPTGARQRHSLLSGLSMLARVTGLLPLIVVFLNSFRDLQEIAENGLIAFPRSFNFHAWSEAWSTFCVGGTCAGISRRRRVLVFKKCGRQLHRAEHPIALGLCLLPRLSLRRRQRLEIQIHARRSGQILQHVHERALLDLGEKSYGVTFFAAAEAVEVTASLVDVERRRFLAVEWAKTHPTPCTRPFELHMTLDDLCDVGAVQYVVDLVPGD